MASGQVWIGSELWYQPMGGPNVRYYHVNADKDELSIVYSSSKEAGANAKVYFHFAGSKWFDYAQITEQRTGWLNKTMQHFDDVFAYCVKKVID